MIIRLAHIVLIFALATLQVVLSLWFDRWTPELILVGILAFSLTGDLLDSWWWIALGGILLDLLGGTILGLHLLLFSIISGILVILTRQVLNKPSLLVAFAIFLVTAISYEFLIGLFSRQVTWHVLLPALTTAVLAGLAYSILQVVGRRREVIQLI